MIGGVTMSEKSDKLRAMLAKEKERRIKLNNRIEILERRIAAGIPAGRLMPGTGMLAANL